MFQWKSCLVGFQCGLWHIGLGFEAVGSDSKESAFNSGDPVSVPGSGRSPGEGNGYPLQYACLENSMDQSLVGYSPWGREVRHGWATNTFTFFFFLEAFGRCLCLLLLLCWLLDIFICSHNTAFFRYAEDKIASAEAQIIWAPWWLKKGIVRIRCQVAAERVARYQILNCTAQCYNILSVNTELNNECLLLS